MKIYTRKNKKKLSNDLLYNETLENKINNNINKFKFKKHFKSNLNKSDFQNNDRQDKIDNFAKDFAKLSSKKHTFMLNSGKGVGKTYLAIKFAISQNINIDIIDISELKNSESKNKEL